jgi:hypothetical protein
MKSFSFVAEASDIFNLKGDRVVLAYNLDDPEGVKRLAAHSQLRPKVRQKQTDLNVLSSSWAKWRKINHTHRPSKGDNKVLSCDIALMTTVGVQS